MKFLLNLFSFLVLSLIGLSSVFALNAPDNFKIDSVNDNSVDLSWDLVNNAYVYYVSYWTTSWWTYENQTDFIDGNKTSIPSLIPWTTYYFVVTSLDENWKESSFSRELSLDFNKKIFSLESVSVKSKNNIELKFSEPLDSTEWTEREFNIYKKSNKLDDFNVISSNLDANDNSKLNIVLDRDIEPWIEYEIVVVAIKNKSLKNIESWIDSIEWFILNSAWIGSTLTGSTSTGSTLTGAIVNDLNSAWTGSTSTGSIVNDLNSAWIEKSSVVWANVDNKELNNTTLWAAENNNKLPKTWPESILILILSVILWALVFVFKYKKA